MPLLAALCTVAPESVGRSISQPAQEATAAIKSTAENALRDLKRDLVSWSLGFPSIRMRSLDHLNAIWNDRRQAKAALGHDAAGGARSARVPRKLPSDALATWWNNRSSNLPPAVIVGREGTGKTWATLDWLVAHQNSLPVVIVIPSSAVTPDCGQSAAGFKRFLAAQLNDLASVVRGETYWRRRLDQWLAGPNDAGPYLLLVFDGLNQHSTAPWLRLLQQTQSSEFIGRLGVVLNTRTHHFSSKLGKLRRLEDAPTVVTLGNYDDDEMDQMLLFHGLTQNDLASDVLELARTPGLFDIVLRLREGLPSKGLTVHRVIWEYGRDTLGRRGTTEDDWLDWLYEVARKGRDSIVHYSRRSLVSTADRSDLTKDEVYGRLSDIIDGSLGVTDQRGDYRPRPKILAHALALALLDHLTTRLQHPACECVHQELGEWLDPIERLDQTAEILRAAVAILVAQGRAEQPPIPSAVVTTWLHTQNAPETHRQEVIDQAKEFPTALLDAIEKSNSLTHNASRRIAMLALRSVSRQDAETMEKIFSRVTGWLSVISLTTRHDADATSVPEWSSKHFISRIDTDREGWVTILGCSFQLVIHEAPYCKAVIPAIIEGFPLAMAQSVFEAFAIHESVALGQSLWNDFRWITCFEGNDCRPTAAALRDLANDIASRPVEAGIDANLPGVVARRLLLLTGNEKDEEEAAKLLQVDAASRGDPAYVGGLTSSLLPIDVRCREIMMRDAGPELCSQAQSLSDLWADPSFQPSQDLIDVVLDEAAQVDVTELVHNAGRTREELFFDAMIPAMARCCPHILSDIARQRLHALASCAPYARFRGAWEGTDHYLLADDVAAAAARALRCSSTDDDDGREAHAAANLLFLELFNLPFCEQCRALIDADLKYIPADFATVLNRARRQDIDVLVDKYGSGSPKEQYDLLSVLSLLPWGSANGTLLSAGARSWLERAALHQEDRSRQLAFKTLFCVDPKRFGQLLSARRWTWEPANSEWINHYGTDALVEATLFVSFTEVAPRLAPWRLLAAARRRGGFSGDVRLAAKMLANAMGTDCVTTAPDSPADVTIDRARADLWPLNYSVEPRPMDYGDGWEALSRSLDIDSRVQDSRRVTKAVSQAVSNARRSGASLYHIHFDTRDLAPVFDHAPDLVDQWLQGLSADTPDLRKRIRLAEGFYLALCEGLLENDPKRGAHLWHTIRKTKTVRFAGAGNVDWMILMPFQVPKSEPVVELREYIRSPYASNTDEALLDLAIGARACGKSDWLNQCCEADLSTDTWHRERGIVLQGFAAHESRAMIRPLAQMSTSDPGAHQRHRAAGWVRSWVSASHWWHRYKTAEDPSDAYAAWMLFLRSVDRRSWHLMEQEIAEFQAQAEPSRLKLAHAVLNRHNVRRAAKEREAKFDQGYLFRRVGTDVGPWASD